MPNPHIYRNIQEINKVFLLLENAIPNELIEKYYVDYYVKSLYTTDLMKISILYFYSKEKCLKHFLESFFKSKFLCKLFKIPIVSFQQVFKALKNRCWLFYQEVFFLIYNDLSSKKSYTNKRFLKNKEIKILDSSFLKCPISRSYLSKKGYCGSENKYVEGLKLHLLYNFSNSIPEKFLETSANVHDSKIADVILNNTKNCILLIDKGYYQLKRFLDLNENNISFVIPLKKNAVYNILEETKFECEISDIILQKIQLSNNLIVRKVKINSFELITNDLNLKWYEIIELYTFRWEIELLFKKLKSNWSLNKSFFRNQNSIMSFICLTIISFILLEYFANLINYSIKEVTLEVGRSIEGFLAGNLNLAIT